MFVLWFIIGIILIFGIARYNESNKLFWTLFASFVGAFAFASVIIAANHEPSKKNINQMYSTQLCIDTSNASYALLADVLNNTTNGTEKSEPVAVSQFTSELINVPTYSEDFALRIYKPFILQLCTVISTHLDYYNHLRVLT